MLEILPLVGLLIGLVSVPSTPGMQQSTLLRNA